MSLVRHVTAPPSGRATADTDPLYFDLAVHPDPLRVSPSSGAAAKGDLIVVASLAAEASVECRSFTLTLKAGAGENDLCSSLTGVTGRISLAGWTGTVNASAGTLTFAPGPGAPAQTEFGPDTGVTFQVMGLPVNQRVGLSQVDISASWRTPGTANWQSQTAGLGVGKFPLGFHLRSFVAEPQSVPKGGSVTLRWDASAATHLTLYYDGESHPVTGESSVTVPDMRQTTFFHLRAVAQEGAGSVERTLTVLVQVSGPVESVGRVIVRGTLQVGEIGPAASPGTPLVFPQRLPALPEAHRTDKFGWQDSHWIRSALPVGAPALYSHTTGQPVESELHPYVELVYQPLGGSDLVWSSFDGYAWTRVEEPVGPGADPSVALMVDWLLPLPVPMPLLWTVYRGGGNNTQVMTRQMQLDGKWGGPVPAPGGVTTQFRPALADLNTASLFLAVTDRTDMPPLHWRRRHHNNEPASWSEGARMPGAAATGAPALAAFGSRMICVYPSNGSHRMNYHDGSRWVAGAALPPGPAPAGPPSLAAHEGRLYCVYREVSGRAQLMSYNGTAWTGPSPVSDRIYAHDPALVATGGRLWLF
ncbi:hypothetical protein ACFVT6_31315 [Streptomyces sp. NPDC058049]|uniref:hypothetical protein n=1 Tax=Streptomyces sp. NPDC058049 TaxID=3346314 RepID=UPI0036E229C9